MALMIATSCLLTIALLLLVIPQNGVESVRQVYPPYVTNNCQRFALRDIQTPSKTHKLLRITKLDKVAAADVDENAESEEHIQLSQMSRREFFKLFKTGRLQLVANDYAEEQEAAENAAAQLEIFLEQEEEEEDAIEEDVRDEDAERSKKRPWRKVQRIVRRQLIKVPKRYFKKFIHKIGL